MFDILFDILGFLTLIPLIVMLWGVALCVVYLTWLLVDMVLEDLKGDSN